MGHRPLTKHYLDRSLVHACVDLETGGVRAGCQIYEIGVTFFSLEAGIIQSIEFAVPSRVFLKYRLDPDTLKFWVKTNPQQFLELYCRDFEFNPAEPSIRYGLFPHFLRVRKVEMLWGHGIDFDKVILEDFMRMEGLAYPYSIPWSDTRTLFAAAGLDYKSTGIHRGVQDSFHCAAAIMKSLEVISQLHSSYPTGV